MICFLEIFKAKKFGMHFLGGLTFGSEIFGVLLEVLGILFWFYFLPPFTWSLECPPGLLPDYHMQST